MPKNVGFIDTFQTPSATNSLVYPDSIRWYQDFLMFNNRQ